VALILKHQTPAQFAARFWRKLQYEYDIKNKPEYCRLIWLIYKRIQAGDMTSNEVRLSYNNFYGKSLNTTQWNAYVTDRFIPAKDRWQAILDEARI
jgi:hypothetical protein